MNWAGAVVLVAFLASLTYGCRAQIVNTPERACIELGREWISKLGENGWTTYYCKELSK